MPFHTTDISGLLVYEPKLFEDSRGYFFESYNEKVFKEQGIDLRFVQDNQSSSVYGVIRGLHYQLQPHAQTINDLPISLTILGGGVIGCEYACMFAALGVGVTLVDARSEILPFLDAEIVARLKAAMSKWQCNRTGE